MITTEGLVGNLIQYGLKNSVGSDYIARPNLGHKACVDVFIDSRFHVLEPPSRFRQNEIYPRLPRPIIVAVSFSLV